MILKAENNHESPRPALRLTQADYQQLAELLITLAAYLDVLPPAAALPDRDDLAHQEIEYVKVMVQALFLGVRQHCMLAWKALDRQRINQLARDLYGRRQRLADDARQTLLPIARTIQAVFENRNTCDCMAGTCRGMVEVVEAIHARIPDPSTN